MNYRSLISGLLLLFTLVAVPAPISRAEASAATDQTFIQLQHDWAEARKHADMPFLERFYATEFSVGNMDGSESTRAHDLSMFSSGDLKPAVISDTGMRVNRYGGVAMVTGLEHLEGTYKGNSGAFDLRFTNVYVYRDGRWQLVRHQAAQIRPK